MGWWGTGIMEGDSPLDDVGEIADICGVTYTNDNSGDGDGYTFTSSVLDQHQGVLKEKIAATHDLGRRRDRYITFQVWAYIVMNNGSEMTDEMKQLFLQACEDDEWGKEDERRQESISDFRQKIEEYEGHSVDLRDHHKGLFDSIAHHLGLEPIEVGEEAEEGQSGDKQAPSSIAWPPPVDATRSG